MNVVVKNVKRSVKICKLISKSGTCELKVLKRKFILKKKQLYKGYYASRVVHHKKHFLHRLLFGSLSLSIAIIEPTEKQKFAFMKKMRETYSKCSNGNKKSEEFEQCKACKSQLKSYLKPLNEDISEGYHLRQDVVTYIANFCGIDQNMAIEFLLSVDKNDDFVHELCIFMSPCSLSDETKACPTDDQQKRFKYDLKKEANFEDCFDCKRKFSKKLQSLAPKPFILNGNVKKATKQFTKVEDDWIWGKEEKREYIERVCGIMGVCDDE